MYVNIDVANLPAKIPYISRGITNFLIFIVNVQAKVA